MKLIKDLYFSHEYIYAGKKLLITKIKYILKSV